MKNPILLGVGRATASITQRSIKNSTVVTWINTETDMLLDIADLYESPAKLAHLIEAHTVELAQQFSCNVEASSDIGITCTAIYDPSPTAQSTPEE